MATRLLRIDMTRIEQWRSKCGQQLYVARMRPLRLARWSRAGHSRAVTEEQVVRLKLLFDTAA